MGRRGGFEGPIRGDGPLLASATGLAGDRRRPAVGQALVEFALVLPVLALLFAAVIQLAFVYETQMGVTNATREAARRAAAFPTDATNRDANADWILDRLAELLPEHVQAYNAAEASLEVCYVSTVDPAGESQLHAEVSVAYRHVLFIPLVAGIFDGLDGVNDDRMEVGASTQIRVRNSPGLGSATCYS